jgi:hypothetical protein
MSSSSTSLTRALWWRSACNLLTHWTHSWIVGEGRDLNVAMQLHPQSLEFLLLLLLLLILQPWQLSVCLSRMDLSLKLIFHYNKRKHDGLCIPVRFHFTKFISSQLLLQLLLLLLCSFFHHPMLMIMHQPWHYLHLNWLMMHDALVLV